MTRTNRSARQAGARFERHQADYWAQALDDDRIDRRVKRGANDRGDISGVRIHGQRLVIECKDTARLELAKWAAEAHTEAGNDDALAGITIHKRRGTSDPGKQWVTATVDDILALIDGRQHGHRAEEATA